MSVRSTILANLETAIETVVATPTGYELPWKSVARFAEHSGLQAKYDLPMVMVIDDGVEDLPMVMVIDDGVEDLLMLDGTNYLYRMPLKIRVLCKCDTKGEIPATASKAISDVKKFINSQPSLGSAARGFQYIEHDGNVYYPDQGQVAVMVSVVINYICVAGTF